MKGVADVIGYDKTSGRWTAVDVKAPGGSLRKEQAAWLRDLRNAGGDTFIAKSVEDFKTKYQKSNLIVKISIS
ncbi:MAG: VRR-NUC domain-containing protein [Bacteroidetes bacterium]|nr:VRR-NUC domain-containing protein [Bacteroidota bacterium]